MLFVYEPKFPKTDKLLKYLQEQTTKQEIYVSEPKRSSSQNRLFHSNAQILAKFNGNTVDEMKAILKHGITDTGLIKLVNYIIVKGRPIPVYVSTADMTIKDFGILMNYVYDIGKKLELSMNYPGDEVQDTVKIANEVFGEETPK